MVILDLINLKKIRKAILYIVCIIVTLVLQTMIFSRIEILGAKPLFVPVVVIAIGFLEGGVWGGAFGLIAGYFCDMSFSANTALFLILFAAFGFLAGFCVKFFINRKFFSYLIMCLVMLAVTAICQIVPLWVFGGTPLGDLVPTAALQTLWSLPFAVPAFFACRTVSRHESEE